MSKNQMSAQSQVSQKHAAFTNTVNSNKRYFCCVPTRRPMRSPLHIIRRLSMMTKIKMS